MSTLPAAIGTYILILSLPHNADITIGKRGTFHFAAGDYGYIGSAFGGGGLNGRLKHHLAPVKKPHWHIDYLRQQAHVRAVWYLASDRVYEHAWAQTLLNVPHTRQPVPRFGASDCQCPAHLVYFTNPPRITAYRALLNVPLCTYAVDDCDPAIV